MNKFKPMNRHARTTRAFLLGWLVASCGCAHTLEKLPNPRGSLFGKDRVAQAPKHAQAPNQSKAAAAARPVALAHSSRISDDNAMPTAARSSAAPALAANATRAVVPVSYDEPVPQNAAAQVLASSIVDPNCLPPSSTACATDSNGNSCAPVPCGPMLETVPQYWNDQEYIYDGGDRAPKVQVTDNWRVHGLDSQDTVAHYETLEGKLCVSPSNRVPIYAPRFGAVRKTTAPTLQAGAVGARGMTDPLGAVVKASNEPVGDLVLPQGPRLRDAIAPIDSVRDRTRGVEAEKILPPANLGSYQMALKQLQSLGPASRREDLLAIIGQYMVNARTWTNPEGLSVAISGVVAVQVRDVKEVQDVTLYETEPGKCSLRICKAASQGEANPGDIISFSIRFENTGSKPIGNLVILDSLVSRLEYIDGSQQCVLSLASNKTPDKEKNPVKFSTAENEAGSTVLRWECDLPLETADSGVITFRCRVR